MLAHMAPTRSSGLTWLAVSSAAIIGPIAIGSTAAQIENG